LIVGTINGKILVYSMNAKKMRAKLKI